MTALLPPRAPAAGTRPRSARRRVARIGVAIVALVALVAGLGWALRSASADPAGRTEMTTSASGRVAHQSAPVKARADHRHATPPPLAPVPPPDGRDAPDPFVLADGARHVLYSTQVGFHNVPVATSTDLRHWSPPGDALPQLPGWAAWGRTWAPGVVRLDDGYLLYFAARHEPSGRQCIGVATATTATGPFVSQAPEPLVCQTDLGGSIDPHPFVDRDGTVLLLWKADGNAVGQPSTLYVQPLTPDGVRLTGRAVPLLRSDAAWEQPLIENPALVATGSSYTLLYSGGWWDSAGYATGYATCDTALGPCSKATTDHPLLASGDGQAGPGGASVVTGPAGDQWLVYHAWSSGAVGYDNGGTRSLRFATLGWAGARPVVKR
jgi:beta-xylosidase